MSQTNQMNEPDEPENKPTLAQVLAFINSASEQDVELVRELIADRREYLRWQITNGLKVDQRVSFEARGLTLTGFVVKVNKKSVKVRVESTGRSGARACHWRVSPELLRIIPE